MTRTKIAQSEDSVGLLDESDVLHELPTHRQPHESAAARRGEEMSSNLFSVLYTVGFFGAPASLLLLGIAATSEPGYLVTAMVALLGSLLLLAGGRAGEALVDIRNDLRAQRERDEA